jgi:hypothetical protein
MHGPGSPGALLSQYGVQMVFNGHMHGYERNTRQPGESFVSYVTGGGGATPESVGSAGCGSYDAYAIGWSQTRQAGSSCGAARPPRSASQVYHFLMVSVNGPWVTVTPTDSTGRTFDVQTYHFPEGAITPATASAARMTRPRPLRAPVGARGGIRPPHVTCVSPSLTPRVRWTVRNVRTGTRRIRSWTGGGRGTVLRVAAGRYASTTVASCGTRRTVRHHAVHVRRKTAATTMSRAEYRRISLGMTRKQVTRVVGYPGRARAAGGGLQTVGYELMRFMRRTDVDYRHGRVVAKHWNAPRR